MVERDNAEKEGQIKLIKNASWSDIAQNLPPYSPHYENFIRGYVDVQLLLRDGNRKKASEKLDHLESDKYFLRFEQANRQLFAAIDICIRNETRWVDEDDNPVVPSFTINDIPMFKRDEG